MEKYLKYKKKYIKLRAGAVGADGAGAVGADGAGAVGADGAGAAGTDDTAAAALEAATTAVVAAATAVIKAVEAVRTEAAAAGTGTEGAAAGTGTEGVAAGTDTEAVLDEISDIKKLKNMTPKKINALIIKAKNENLRRQLYFLFQARTNEIILQQIGPGGVASLTDENINYIIIMSHEPLYTQLKQRKEEIEQEKLQKEIKELGGLPNIKNFIFLESLYKRAIGQLKLDIENQSKICKNEEVQKEIDEKYGGLENIQDLDVLASLHDRAIGQLKIDIRNQWKKCKNEEVQKEIDEKYGGIVQLKEQSRKIIIDLMEKANGDLKRQLENLLNEEVIKEINDKYSSLQSIHDIPILERLFKNAYGSLKKEIFDQIFNTRRLIALGHASHISAF